MSSRRTEFTDTDLTFLVHVYGNGAELASCLGSLRSVYPDSRLLLVSDGDDDSRLPEITRRHSAELIRGKRLFPIDNGGKIVQRLLDAYLRQPTDYLFKIDPDTRVHRRFRYLPTICSTPDRPMPTAPT